MLVVALDTFITEFPISNSSQIACESYLLTKYQTTRYKLACVKVAVMLNFGCRQDRI